MTHEVGEGSNRVMGRSDMEAVLPKGILILQTRPSEGDFEMVRVEARLRMVVLVPPCREQPFADDRGVMPGSPVEKTSILPKTTHGTEKRK